MRLWEQAAASAQAAEGNALAAALHARAARTSAALVASMAAAQSFNMVLAHAPSTCASVHGCVHVCTHVRVGVRPCECESVCVGYVTL